MDNKRKRIICCASCIFAVMFLMGCSGTSGEDGSIVSSDFLVSPDETYEKASNSGSDYQIKDKASLYEGDNLSVVTMYLTVGQGNEEDGTKHTWTEVNEYPLEYYEENGIANPYKCEAVLQVGDDNGPVEDEFGYGVNAANATVRLRGEGASGQAQKSYRIDIKDGKGKWEDQKAIVLNKYVTDPLRFTNKLAYSLMEDIPAMISVRTRFVHLYVKDKTEGADGLFADYGLFTQTEQINKTYLKNHGFDNGGQLYKAEDFDWQRHEDGIVPATSEDYDPARFEQYLEVKGDEDHTKLIEMLKAVNDDAMDIKDVVRNYFDEDNLYYWMAFHMLTGNKNQNYYLYSPQTLDKWYFISGNNADSFSEIYERMYTLDYSSSWNRGIFTYCNSVLFARILRDTECRQKFDAAVDNIKNNYLTEQRISEEADAMKEMVVPYLYSLPDSLFARVTPDDYEAIMEGLGAEIEENYQLYKESLNQPWPFHILEPQVSGKKLKLCWEEAYLYNDPQETKKGKVTYSVELADTYTFDNCIVSDTDVSGTSLDVDNLPAGQYFVRIRAKTDSGYTQDSYEYYRTERGTTIYSTQCFYVQQDGSVELSLYNEED